MYFIFWWKYLPACERETEKETNRTNRSRKPSHSKSLAFPNDKMFIFASRKRSLEKKRPTLFIFRLPIVVRSRSSWIITHQHHDESAALLNVRIFNSSSLSSMNHFCLLSELSRFGEWSWNFSYEINCWKDHWPTLKRTIWSKNHDNDNRNHSIWN